VPDGSRPPDGVRTGRIGSVERGRASHGGLYRTSDGNVGCSFRGEPCRAEDIGKTEAKFVIIGDDHSNNELERKVVDLIDRFSIRGKVFVEGLDPERNELCRMLKHNACIAGDDQEHVRGIDEIYSELTTSMTTLLPRLYSKEEAAEMRRLLPTSAGFWKAYIGISERLRLVAKNQPIPGVRLQKRDELLPKAVAFSRAAADFERFSGERKSARERDFARKIVDERPIRGEATIAFFGNEHVEALQAVLKGEKRVYDDAIFLTLKEEEARDG
jgi:hypothetical protein